MSYFPEPYTRSKNKIKAELDLFNYSTKFDLKNATGVDTSKFAKKADLATLKSDSDKLHIVKLVKVPSGLSSLKNKIDKLEVDKLALVPVYLKKLSDVVDNDVVKKTVYDELVKKVNAIDTSDLAKKIDYDAKINEIKVKLSNITGLATTSILAKKAIYDGKISDIEKRYFTTSDYNTFTNGIFDVNMKNKELVNKSDIYKFINNSDLDKKIDTFATKTELKAEKDKIVKLETQVLQVIQVLLLIKVTFSMTDHKISYYFN